MGIFRSALAGGILGGGMGYMNTGDVGGTLGGIGAGALAGAALPFAGAAAHQVLGYGMAGARSAKKPLLNAAINQFGAGRPYLGAGMIYGRGAMHKTALGMAKGRKFIRANRMGGYALGTLGAASAGYIGSNMIGSNKGFGMGGSRRRR